MSIKKEAQVFLDKCRVIAPTESKEGVIVQLDVRAEFQVIEVTKKNGAVSEEEIAQFGLFDIIDEDRNKMILNFKKVMSEIVGRKRYYVETSVYNFLVNDDVPDDDEPDYDEFYNEDAEERAAREAAEEEAAEQAFDDFLKANGM